MKFNYNEEGRLVITQEETDCHELVQTAKKPIVKIGLEFGEDGNLKKAPDEKDAEGNVTKAGEKIIPQMIIPNSNGGLLKTSRITKKTKQVMNTQVGRVPFDLNNGQTY